VTLIQSRLKPSGESFRSNRAHNLAICQALREQKERLQRGGGDKAMARHTAQGKMFVRDRIAALCDPGTPFLEVGLLAALGVYDDPVPAAGLVAGVGMVAGRPCMIERPVYKRPFGATRSSPPLAAADSAFTVRSDPKASDGNEEYRVLGRSSARSSGSCFVRSSRPFHMG